MNGDVATSAIGASHACEFLELSTGNLVTNGSRSLFPAAHRIKDFAVWMQGKETGRADLGCQLGGRKPPVVRVEGGVVDALGPATTGPEKDVERLGHAKSVKHEK